MSFKLTDPPNSTKVLGQKKKKIYATRGLQTARVYLQKGQYFLEIGVNIITNDE